MAHSRRHAGLCSGVFLLAVSAVGAQLLLSSCRYPLGIQDGLVPDNDLTASSEWYSSTAAKYGRLESLSGDGGWCPAGPLLPSSAEFLQVTFPAARVIVLVATQGRHHAGGSAGPRGGSPAITGEFAEHYRLQYSRDGRRWTFWRDRHGVEILRGNVDADSSVLRELSPPIIASHLRFVPLVERSTSVCMRVEAFGCPWLDELVSYSLPRGHVMKMGGGQVAAALEDETYDGYVTRGYISGGLGQLTDGRWGGDRLAEASEPAVTPGYDYVGWNRSALPYVETEFVFQKPREFVLMQVHCSNEVDEEVREFNAARCFLRASVSSEWGDDPVVFDSTRDWGPRKGTRPDPRARFVSIPLLGRTGIAIKCRFYFSDTWLLISEISFHISVPSDGEQGGPGAPSKPPAPPSISKTTGKRLTTAVTSSSTSSSISSPMEESRANAPPRGRAAAPGPPVQDGVELAQPTSGGGSSAVVASLALAVAVLVAVIAALLWRQRRQKAARRRPRQHLTVSLSPSSSSSSATAARAPNAYEESAEMTALGRGVQGYRAVPPAEPLCSPPPPPVSHHRLPSPLAMRKLPELPQSAEDAAGGGDDGDGGYAEPDITKTARWHDESAGAGGGGAGDGAEMFPRTGLCSPDGVPPYAEAVILPTGVSLVGGMLEGVYAVPVVGGGCTPPREFPRHCLRFREKLGEGRFGEVHLCEVEEMDQATLDSFGIPTPNGRTPLVAVKTLRTDASLNSRSDFLKEVAVMCRLRDPNVSRLIGACLASAPLCAVTDYMDGGDLHQFLSRRRWEGCPPHHPDGEGAVEISVGQLLWLSEQVASGMKHLSSLGLVHRDVAARNCLVDASALVVRVADFGLSRDLYRGDYYRAAGRAVLPIRWLAWESLLLGKFTSASDVWAFGVTLWEILTLCRTQPFHGLTDEQVVENAGEVFRNQGKQVILSEPDGCPSGARALMLRCWSRDAARRPDFAEIHAALGAERRPLLPLDSPTAHR